MASERHKSVRASHHIGQHGQSPTTPAASPSGSFRLPRAIGAAEKMDALALHPLDLRRAHRVHTPRRCNKDKTRTPAAMAARINATAARKFGCSGRVVIRTPSFLPVRSAMDGNFPLQFQPGYRQPPRPPAITGNFVRGSDTRSGHPRESKRHRPARSRTAPPALRSFPCATASLIRATSSAAGLGQFPGEFSGQTSSASNSGSITPRKPKSLAWAIGKNHGFQNETIAPPIRNETRRREKICAPGTVPKAK